MAPGGNHCEIQQLGCSSFLKVHRGPREHGVRPSIDVLFRSAAMLYGSDVLGIILSGNGPDGLAGAKAIHNAGGHTIVQDPGSAMVDELPLSAIREGVADNYFSAEQIGEHLLKHISPADKDKQKTKSYDYNLYKRDLGYFISV